MGNFRELLELQLVSQTTPLHVQLESVLPDS